MTHFVCVLWAATYLIALLLVLLAHDAGGL